MRKELIDIMQFLKSVWVSDSRTIHTCNYIDTKMLQSYANIIEKIVSNDVILVDKNELEHKFEDVPIDIRSNNVVLRKDFHLRSQLRISPFEYAHMDKKDFQEFINKTLTNKLLDYFINEVGIIEKDKSE